MHRRQTLHGGAEQREVADLHRAQVQHHTIEVEEDALAELDVRTVMAEERRLLPHCLSAGTKQLGENATPLLLLRFARGIDVEAPRAL